MTAPPTIRSDDGLALEAALDEPDRPPVAAAVFCHPHPRMGGTMNAPLLLALRDALVARAWAVLRFNFRGIGASEGEAADGVAEVADARGALAEARRRWPEVPHALLGWSFGAAVAVRTAADDHDLLAVAAIAPAVVARPGITAGLPDPAGVRLAAPLLMVCGDNDHLVAVDDCLRWARVAGGRVEVVRGGNHFFWGRYGELTSIVADFLDDPHEYETGASENS